MQITCEASKEKIIRGYAVKIVGKIIVVEEKHQKISTRRKVLEK